MASPACFTTRWRATPAKSSPSVTRFFLSFLVMTWLNCARRAGSTKGFGGVFAAEVRCGAFAVAGATVAATRL